MSFVVFLRRDDRQTDEIFRRLVSKKASSLLCLRRELDEKIKNLFFSLSLSSSLSLLEKKRRPPLRSSRSLSFSLVLSLFRLVG